MMPLDTNSATSPLERLDHGHIQKSDKGEVQLGLVGRIQTIKAA